MTHVRVVKSLAATLHVAQSSEGHPGIAQPVLCIASKVKPIANQIVVFLFYFIFLLETSNSGLTCLNLIAGTIVTKKIYQVDGHLQLSRQNICTI